MRNHITCVIPILVHLILFQLNGQEQTINVNEQVGQSIVLRHDQNTLNLEYVALHYDNPEKIQYKYQLSGLHDHWIEAGNQRIARFTDLPPGHYQFKVLAANPDGVWSTSPAVVDIVIRPPWYWTTWSKLCYLSLFLGCVAGLYQIQLRRRLELAETEKLRELDQVKSRLYTNITHEFRTPLTVIQGLAQQIKGQDKLKNTIERSSVNLLNLVNQMLDLSRLDAGQMQAQYVQGDVVGYLKYLLQSFESMARSNKIRLHFIAQMGSFYMDYDPDKMLKITANLLSNAIKFTEAGGDVYLMVSTNELIHERTDWKSRIKSILPTKESLILQVKDTGIGISEEDLNKIFDRFYQVPDGGGHHKSEGTGIGLAYTNELVRLLDGEIYVESEVDKGSLFSVILPVSREYPMTTDPLNFMGSGGRQYEKQDVEPIQLLENDDNLPLVLIVEDNPDVLDYIMQCLFERFRLTTARNGEQAINKILDIIPDLVVSDVMMPAKDGFALCDEIKNNFRTSHIPVILLTAKSDAVSRITGLRAGADAYLSKPFDAEELVVRVEQLIGSRRRLQERYGQGISSISLHTRDTQYQKEDSFILELQSSILDHLEDEQFDSGRLAQVMGMSLSQLYRKIKALTGKSTAVYIRSIRLTRAYEMLRQTDKTISEIAFEVGFKDAAYFSKCFRESYGDSPRSMRN